MGKNFEAICPKCGKVVKVEASENVSLIKGGVLEWPMKILNYDEHKDCFEEIKRDISIGFVTTEE